MVAKDIDHKIEITRRLRCASTGTGLRMDFLVEDAATEIERLRDLLRAALEHLEPWSYPERADREELATAINAQLSPNA